MTEAWPSLFRITVGLYWLYFASTKWLGVGWVQGLLQTAGAANPIPGLRVLWRRSVYPFTVERMVAAGGPITLTAAEARTRLNANYVRAKLAARRHGNAAPRPRQ